MTELVTKNYWWPGIMRNVGKYVRVVICVKE